MPLKIAFVVKNFPSLSETFILNQITGLIDRGHEVEIFARRAKNDGETHPEIEEYDLLERTHYFPEIPKNKLFRIAKGFRYLTKNFFRNPGVMLRSLNPFAYGLRALTLQLLFEVSWPLRSGTSFDVVHCHFGPSGCVGVLLRELGAFDAPILTSFHGYDVHVLPGEGWLEPYLKLFNQGELFTANTEFTKKSLNKLGLSSEKIAMLPMSLRLENFRPPEPRDSSDDRPIRLLTVARLVRKKGLEDSIRAAAKLRSVTENFRYDIVGGGPREEKLGSLIDELDLGDTVTLHDRKTRDDVLEFYRDADVFVLTSVTAENGDMEGQGLVLQEAQAMKLPVVTTDHNGLPEGVLEGESAFLVDEGDTDAIAKNLEHLIENPEKRKKMGERGHEYVRENYGLDRLIDKQIKLYKKLYAD